MPQTTFENLTKCSIKSLYNNNVIQFIKVSEDFKIVSLIRKDSSFAEITVSKKSTEILSASGLTKDLIIRSSILLLEEIGATNKLIFFISNYTDLSEIFENDVNVEEKKIKSNQAKIITEELKKYWKQKIEI